MKPHKPIVLVIFTLLFILSVTNCTNKQLMLEAEQLQILNYIQNTGLDLDTLRSGVLLHVDTSLDTIPIYPNDKVLLVYTGYNLDDNNKIFVKNDSVYLPVSDPYLLDGWKDIFLTVPNKTYGTAIFPFYTAYNKKRIASVAPYSTLVFDFYVEKHITQSKKK
jgi:hypothetical protein